MPLPPVPPGFVEIRWTCQKCNVRYRPVRLRARGPDEDVLAFTDRAVTVAGEMHNLISPTCPSHTLDLMFSVPDRSKAIGDCSDAFPAVEPNFAKQPPTEDR